MQLVTYIQSLDDFNQLPQTFSGEIILSHRLLSNLGELDDELFYTLFYEAHRRQLPVVLDWDLLMTEGELDAAQKKLMTLPLAQFKAIRVQDLGAAHWIHTQFPQLKIQLICETANHNIEALKVWESFFGPQLDRLVLSIELSHPTLIQMCTQLKTPLEILILGPILLFHTPRSLLSPLNLITEKSNRLSKLEFFAESEESVHKGFRVVENGHGTQMFYPKDYCLLDFIPDLFALKTMWGRVDLRNRSKIELMGSIVELTKNFSKDLLSTIKENYEWPLMNSFFRVNKTTAIFKRLKNPHLNRNRYGLLGEVVDVHKGKLMGIHLTEPNATIEKGQTVHFISPYGKSYFLQIDDLKNSAMEKISLAKQGDVVYVKALRGVACRSLVFIPQKD